jgi:dTDP-4-dehydrorhamnose 3,5-epimerase
MQIKKTKLDGLYILSVDKFVDARGYNLSMFHEKEYMDKITEITGQSVTFVENLLSFSSEGVLRGMHYDIARWKLCQCLFGKIYYVAVNVETKQHESIVLSSHESVQILKAPHLAHGFQIMSTEALFFYMTSEFRDVKREKIYPWNGFDISWPINPPILSEKDRGEK